MLSVYGTLITHDTEDEIDSDEFAILIHSF